MRVPSAEPNLMGMMLEMVVVTDPGGRANEELLPEVELPEDWVPPKKMTQVYF